MMKHQSGSNAHLWPDGRKTLVTIPVHDELTIGTFISAMKQAQMDCDEFLDMRYLFIPKPEQGKRLTGV